MNLIFLDIDGVLNSINKLIEVYKETGKPHSGYAYPFDERCMENLQILVQETKSKLVITSTWRKDEEGRETLLSEFLIKTNPQTGLTYENVQEAIKRLNVSKIKQDEEIDR